MLQLLVVLLGWIECRGAKLLARMFWIGTGVMTESRPDDPVYKKNVQRLIEHHRKFEDARDEPHSEFRRCCLRAGQAGRAVRQRRGLADARRHSGQVRLWRSRS